MASVWRDIQTIGQSTLFDRLAVACDAPTAAIDATFESYQQGFDQVIDFIRAGDCYQANLTVSGSGRFSGSAESLYHHLLRYQPVPYHAFMPWWNGPAISLSPELLWQVKGANIACEPMKGTVATPPEAADAQQLADWLAQDPKNRAENVMIVDLIRNDLGRIALSGSVSVPRAFEVRRYQTVQQMVSRVTATLRTSRLADWVEALVPFGSITGAPKRRSMEILADLETQPRGIYTGTLGYIYQDQSLANVAIRTLATQDQHFTFGVGGGLTIGSASDDEWQEVRIKARYLNARGMTG